jgi:hypothetical protein
MDIRERILARGDLGELVTRRDLDGIKAKLDAEGLRVPQQRFITGRVIAVMHPSEGRDILRRLEALAEMDIGLRFNMPFLQHGDGIDMGDPGTWRELDTMAQLYSHTDGEMGLSGSQVSMLKEISLTPVIVDRLKVEAAVNEILGSDTA